MMARPKTDEEVIELFGGPLDGERYTVKRAFIEYRTMPDKPSKGVAIYRRDSRYPGKLVFRKMVRNDDNRSHDVRS